MDVNGVRFVYDADGGMVKKVEGSKTTTYVGNYFEKEQALVFVPNTVGSYGAQWKLDNAALPGGRTRKYYFFAGARVAMRENNGSPSWLHSDHLRSASLATDSNGQVVPNSEARYTPFGSYRGTVDGDGLRTNRRFQDAERVASIELDSMGARFYSAGLGRFISADSIVPGAGNPQAFNRYSFVLNNPLKFTDPSGHAQESPKNNSCAGTYYQCYFASVEVRLFGLKLDKGSARTEMMNFFLAHPDANPMDYSAAAGEFYNLAGDAQRDAMYDPAGMKISQDQWAEVAWGKPEINIPGALFGAVMLGRAFGGFASSNGVVSGQSGAYKDLSGSTGDDLTAHHMPQKALGFTSEADGGALVMEQNVHIQTRTYGGRGITTLRQDAGKSFRDVLAADVADVRRLTLGTPNYSAYRSGMQNLLEYYRQKFPLLIQK